MGDAGLGDHEMGYAGAECSCLDASLMLVYKAGLYCWAGRCRGSGD